MRVAVPVIEAVVDTNRSGQGSLLVLGVDMTGDRTLRDYDLDGDDAAIDDPLVFLAQPDSIILSKEFADKNHISVGGRLALGTVEGERQFTVRGVMKSSGLTKLEIETGLLRLEAESLGQVKIVRTADELDACLRDNILGAKFDEIGVGAYTRDRRLEARSVSNQALARALRSSITDMSMGNS